MSNREARVRAGAVLRALRLVRGLSQREFGQRTGMPPTAVSAIETGRNSVPPILRPVFAKMVGLDPDVWLEAVQPPEFEGTTEGDNA